MDHNQRRSYFIKPELQLKYLGIALMLTLAVGLVVYFSLTYALFSSHASAGLSEPEIRAMQSSFRSALGWVLFFTLLIFGLENFIRFHRIAGPLYAMERVITAFSAGDFSQEFRVRKKDELRDLVTDLQVMREGLRRFVQQDRELCKELEGKLDRLSRLIDENASAGSLKQEIEHIRKDLALIAAQYKL